MSNTQSKRKPTLEECKAILTAPGKLHELEKVVIAGRVKTVYKNTPKNIRAFFTSLPLNGIWKDREYLVFENERMTYGDAHNRICKLASLLYSTYGVRKGDRVAIIMRNFPEFIIGLWAIHLVGGIAALLNCWSSPAVIQHCLLNMSPKIIVLDYERADILLGPILETCKAKFTLNDIFLVRANEVGGGSNSKDWRWRWPGMISFDEALESYNGPIDAWEGATPAELDDPSAIMFTSGTTALPKGVIASQRMTLTSLLSLSYVRSVAALRSGKEFVPRKPTDPPKAGMIGIPLFHGAACNITMLMCTAVGDKIVLMRKWSKNEAARIIDQEQISSAGGVPTIVLDLFEAPTKGLSLEYMTIGGAPLPDTMIAAARKRFPNLNLSQNYGITEATVVTYVDGDDFLERPSSCGYPAAVVELLIVDPNNLRILPPRETGEIWVKGITLTGYWNDEAATAKAITRDGWYRTGDLGFLDEEGFLYIKDRLKDIINRGGEKIHCTEIENALLKDDRIISAAAVGVPDPRLGELVSAVVTTKAEFHDKVTQESLIKLCRKILPYHAVPVMVLIQKELPEMNAVRKIMKDPLREMVTREWQKRHDAGGALNQKSKL